MSNNIIDLSAYRIGKENELRAHVGALLDCNAILADAVEQMWDFAERHEILATLRRALEVLQGED